jgi:hypothetical protein
LPDPVDVARARDLLEVASKIESASHHQNKKNKENAWRKKAAEDLDIDLSTDDEANAKPVSDDDDDDVVSKKAVSSAERDELKRLLLAPLPSQMKRNSFRS